MSFRETTYAVKAKKRLSLSAEQNSESSYEDRVSGDFTSGCHCTPRMGYFRASTVDTYSYSSINRRTELCQMIVLLSRLIRLVTN